VAKVPSYGVPQMQARNTPNVRIDDSGANEMRRAGAAIAGGLQDVAGVAGKIAQAEQERVNTAQLMEAQRALGEMELALFNDPEKGAFATQGKHAMGVEQQVLPEYDRRVSEITDKLPQRLQGQFQQFTMRKREANVERLRNHSMREGEKYLDANERATIETIGHTALANYADPKAVDASIDEGMVAVDARIQRLGLGAPAATLARRKFASSVYRSVVEKILPDDPIAAGERLDAVRDLMQPDDVIAVEDKLRPIVQDTHFDAIGQSFVAGLAAQPQGEAAPLPDDPRMIQSTYRALGAQHGFAITSMERPVLAIGAGARSQHPKGTAVDYSVRGKTKAEGDALIADLTSSGFEVVDERDGTTGTGPHIHAELPKGRAPSAPIGTPTTLGDALAAVRTDPRARNPVWRAGVEKSVTRWWSIKERDEADRDSAMLESMRARVDAAAPGVPVSKALGGDYAQAVRKGWTGSLEAIANAKTRGELIETNAVTYDEFARLAVLDPAEFAKPQTKARILAAGHELATNDLGRLLKAHADYNKPDTRAKAIADHATEAQRIQSGLRIAGIDTGKKKGKERAAAFGVAYRMAHEAAIARKSGERLTPQESDQLVRAVATQFAADPDQGRKALAAESLGVVAADVETVRQALIARGTPNPTDAQIQAVIANYYRAANAD
jgi:hypothetical protein